MALETLVFSALNHLVWPLARKRFIGFSRHESYKLYTVHVKVKDSSLPRYGAVWQGWCLLAFGENVVFSSLRFVESPRQCAVRTGTHT